MAEQRQPSVPTHADAQEDRAAATSIQLRRRAPTAQMIPNSGPDQAIPPAPNTPLVPSKRNANHDEEQPNKRMSTAHMPPPRTKPNPQDKQISSKVSIGQMFPAQQKLAPKEKHSIKLGQNDTSLKKTILGKATIICVIGNARPV